MGECYLRCIRLSGEHRLAVKHATDGQSVKTTNEYSLLVCFDRVRPAKFMQSGVSVGHLRRDPGAVLAGPRWIGAAGHHAGKVAVETNLEFSREQGLFQRAGQPEFFGK